MSTQVSIASQSNSLGQSTLNENGSRLSRSSKPGAGRVTSVDDATKAIVSFFNRYYGTRYAFGKLDQVAVPDFSAGAMENTGDIIYRETALLVGDNDSIDRKKGVASVMIA